MYFKMSNELMPGENNITNAIIEQIVGGVLAH